MEKMRDCRECLRPFTPIIVDQQFCCRQCAHRAARRDNPTKTPEGEPIPRLCIVCKTVWFIPQKRSHKICSQECRKEEVRAVAYAYWVAHKQKVKKEEGDIACLECTHWKERTDSDTGGECLISRWSLCKPYLSTTKPFSPRNKE